MQLDYNNMGVVATACYIETFPLRDCRALVSICV